MFSGPLRISNSNRVRRNTLMVPTFWLSRRSQAMAPTYGGTMYVNTNRLRKNFFPYRLVRPTSQASGKASRVPKIMVAKAAMRVLVRAFQFIS